MRTFAWYDDPDYTIDLRGWQPRLVLDSQRIVSREAATFDPLAETNWSRPRVDLPPPHP